MKLILPLALAALSFAGAASLAPVTDFKDIETSTDKLFSADPWDLLGEARGSYLPGYGAIFTFELSLIHVAPLFPFHPTISPQEVRTIHDRKVKQLAVLKTEMRGLVVKAADSLAALPPGEQIVFEARLHNWSFEDNKGLPNRLIMTANRQKVIEALAHHATPAELTQIIGQREE